MAKQRKILVVDDVPMFRELGSLFLARSGKVLTANGGEQGLEIAQAEKPDLIIADLQMPHFDGEALCRAIKNDPQLCATPVVIMLGSNEARDRARAIQAGADDLLPKPLSRLSLVDAVRRFLGYEEVRGLPRVAVTEPVKLTADDVVTWGTMRNLSRGGVFIEIERDLDPWTEVELDFELPETGRHVEPSAQVIWHRPANGEPEGLGLRFLAVTGEVAAWLEDYVWEQTLALRAAPADADPAKSPCAS